MAGVVSTICAGAGSLPNRIVSIAASSPSRQFTGILFGRRARDTNPLPRVSPMDGTGAAAVGDKCREARSGPRHVETELSAIGVAAQGVVLTLSYLANMYRSSCKYAAKHII